MKTKLAVVLVLLLALAGCSAIDSGTITAKKYSESYTYYETVYDCYARDKNGTCTMSIPRQVEHYVPETFKFELTEGDKDGWVYVDGHVYETYEVGEHYPRVDKGTRPS